MSQEPTPPDKQMPDETGNDAFQPLRKLSCKARNDQKWDEIKENIRRVYMDEDKRLEETM
jgi:hypothetical protein